MAKSPRSSSTAAGDAASKLSTNRSRLCRQRQKVYAAKLESDVQALRASVSRLSEKWRQKQTEAQAPTISPSKSIADRVRFYCDTFKNGLPSASPVTGSSKKRPHAELSRETQRDLLLDLMDEDVQVFDWSGQSYNGVAALLARWEAWTQCHSSLVCELESMEVIKATEFSIVRTQCQLRVRTQASTIDYLFPHVAPDDALWNKLVDKDICYALSDTFVFNDDDRVVKYSCDIDFVSALLQLVGNHQDVLRLLQPQEEGQSSSSTRSCRSPLPSFNALPPSALEKDTRLAVSFLLS